MSRRGDVLRGALLAVALLIAGVVHAQDTAGAADTPTAPRSQAPTQTSQNSSEGAQVCSDVERGFPPCSIPKADKKTAKSLYEQGQKLARKNQLDDALLKLKAACAISPLDTVYRTAKQAVAQKVAAAEMSKGNQAMQRGDSQTAVESFRRAVEVDPANEYAEQRLRDALPAPEEHSAKLLPLARETRLQPKDGVQNFEFRGQSIGALQKFAGMFGISTVTQQGLNSRIVRMKLDGVDWQTGSEILQRLCKTLMIPLNDHQVLLANDTEDNRRDLTQMSLRTFYAQGGGTPAELTELVTTLRVMFDLRFITANAAEGTITIRAPQSTMDAVARFLDDIRDDQPTVMLDVKIFEVSSTFTRELGASVPDQFTVFNVPTEVNSLLSSSAYQQIISALTASGQTVNATTILAALLASSSSSSSNTGTPNPLTQPFGIFGGGQTLTGVTIPATTLHFSNVNSLARTVDDVLLRTEHGKAATLKVGERYPIVSSTFAATSAASSLLSQIGLGSTASSSTVPTPQFTYEDIGLVLKATPKLEGRLISLDYELTVRALGATQSNGLPLLTNREVKGTISTEDGEQVVVAGLIEKDEMAAINGLPVVSAIPVLGKVFSVTTKESALDELLIVMRPRITSGRRQQGLYLPMPTNLPK